MNYVDSHFNAVLLNTLNRYAPIKTVQITKPKEPCTTWTNRQNNETKIQRLQRKGQKIVSDFIKIVDTISNMLWLEKREPIYHSKFTTIAIIKKFDKDIIIRAFVQKTKNNQLPFKLKLADEINNYFVTSAATNVNVDTARVEYFSNNSLAGVQYFNFITVTRTNVSNRFLSTKLDPIN